MTELNQKIREAKISKLDNIQDDYDNLVSFAEGLIKYNEAANELFEDRNLVGSADYAKSERQFRINGVAVPFPAVCQRRFSLMVFFTPAHAYFGHSFQDDRNAFCQ